MFFMPPSDDDVDEDTFLQLPGHSGMQMMVNAVGALLRRSGGILTVPRDEMGEKVEGVSIYVFVNPKTGAVRLIADDPRDPRTTPGIQPGHA